MFFEKLHPSNSSQSNRSTLSNVDALLTNKHNNRSLNNGFDRIKSHCPNIYQQISAIQTSIISNEKLNLDERDMNRFQSKFSSQNSTPYDSFSKEFFRFLSKFVFTKLLATFLIAILFLMIVVMAVFIRTESKPNFRSDGNTTNENNQDSIVPIFDSSNRIIPHKINLNSSMDFTNLESNGLKRLDRINVSSNDEDSRYANHIPNKTSIPITLIVENSFKKTISIYDKHNEKKLKESIPMKHTVILELDIKLNRTN